MNFQPTPLFDALSTDLTKLAQEQRLDPVVGRDSELDKLCEVLSGSEPSNVLLVGARGVGRRSIVEGLAQRIVNQNVPATLSGRPVIHLDIGILVLEKRSEKYTVFVKELKAANGILYIPELVQLLKLTRPDCSHIGQNLDILLGAAIAEGFPIIAAILPHELNEWSQLGSRWLEHFSTIHVEEPTVEQAIEMVKATIYMYEGHHQVKVADDVIQAAVELSAKYDLAEALPGKAIGLLDEACSVLRMVKKPTRITLRRTAAELADIRDELDTLADEMTKEHIEELKRRESELAAIVSELEARAATEPELVLTVQDVSETLDNVLNHLEEDKSQTSG